MPGLCLVTGEFRATQIKDKPIFRQTRLGNRFPGKPLRGRRFEV